MLRILISLPPSIYTCSSLCTHCAPPAAGLLRLPRQHPLLQLRYGRLGHWSFLRHVAADSRSLGLSSCCPLLNLSARRLLLRLTGLVGCGRRGAVGLTRT